MVVAEHLRLVSKLGEGGMGSVWVAEHTTLGRRVAVKVISEEAGKISPLMLERFKREAGACASINSPHVVQVFDHGFAADGTPYISMELLEGEGLDRRMKREPQMAPQSVALVVAQTAHVLAKAHALGIVHRDIKPANLFLVESGYGLFVKVLDFGIAKQLDATGELSLTTTGSMLGSPLYMSPEQFASPKSVDGAADLWSLAVVAYHALTGAPPFGGETLGQVMMAVLKRDFASPSRYRPELAPFDAFFARAFAERVEDRFPTAADFGAAFPAAIASPVTTYSRPGGSAADAHRAQADEPSSLAGTLMLDRRDGGPPPAVVAANAPPAAAVHPSPAAAVLAHSAEQAGGARTFAGAASTLAGAPRRSSRGWIVATVGLLAAGGVAAAVAVASPASPGSPAATSEAVDKPTAFLGPSAAIAASAAEPAPGTATSTEPAATTDATTSSGEAGEPATASGPVPAASTVSGPSAPVTTLHPIAVATVTAPATTAGKASASSTAKPPSTSTEPNYGF